MGVEPGKINRVGPRHTKRRLTYEGIPFDANKPDDRASKLRKYPQVADTIAKRKSSLTEEERVKDEERRENTPLQVVENMRDAIQNAQTARVMMQRLHPLLQEAVTTFASAKTNEEKEAAVAEHAFYKKMKDYWAQFGASAWGEMYQLKETYGPGLEAAHREYMGDIVQLVHFKQKFTQLAEVERAIANYKPPLLGLEEKTDPRSKRLQAIAAESLAGEALWSKEKFLEMIPEPGKEQEMSEAGTNLLEVFEWMFGEEEAAEAAREMQERYHGHDISAVEEGSEEVFDLRSMSVAELKVKQEELLGECEELWEHPAVQNMWFERNLHDMIQARLREERVLELPSTIRLLNRISEIERNHPHTTIGVALVGDPGVGKTTVIEHYLKKKGRDYVYIDMTEEVTRYSLIGSPAVHIESQMDFYKRVSNEYGDLADEDVLGMVRRNAENLEKGFATLSQNERQVLAMSLLQEQLDKAAQIDQTADPRLKELLAVEIKKYGMAGEAADQKAVQALKTQVDGEQGDLAQLVKEKMVELRRSLGNVPEQELELAAQTELKSQIENAHTAMRMTDEVRGRLSHVRETLSRVARMKYQDEAAERFADLTKKNGWRDGLVIHALRTNKSILFDEYNAARDWKLLHHLFTLKPGDEYQVGDKAGEKIKIPDGWRMYFTGNIQLKHGVNKLKEALVSRIGGQVMTVEPPPAYEEWLVTVASLSDANDRIVREEKDMVQLGFLINDLFPKIREAMRNAGSPNIVPISFRMIGNITEQLMNHRTQFARPTSVDRALLDEMISPYRNYPDTQNPVQGGDANQLPSLIAKYLVEAGLLLTPEVENEVIAWTGISKEELDKKREARKDQDWHKLMKEIQAKAQGAMSELMPSAFVG